ncbi:MAG: hypothetical protein PHY16_10550 [Methylobacter sp.]|nr:hypothetical protein [Methylobacter sp.]
MTDFQRDILIGLMFIIGIIGVISGEFIISTVLFATAAILSNIFLISEACAGIVSFTER